MNNMKEKKYSMNNDYIPDKVLSKIKEMKDITKIDDTKILFDTDDKFPDLFLNLHVSEKGIYPKLFQTCQCAVFKKK